MKHAARPRSPQRSRSARCCRSRPRPDGGIRRFGANRLGSVGRAKARSAVPADGDRGSCLSLPRRGRAAERSEAGWGLAQRLVDYRKNPLEIVINIVVPKPQHSETFYGEALIALCVTLGVSIEIMLSAVDLDDETMFQTHEVHDEIIARRLAAKMKPALAPRSEVNPKLHFLWRHLLAKAPCDLVRHDPHPAAATRRPPLPPSGEG